MVYFQRSSQTGSGSPPQAPEISNDKQENESDSMKDNQYATSSISSRRYATILFCFGTYLLAGCNGKPSDPKSEAPPPAVVQTDTDVNLVHVDHPDQFTLVPATSYAATSTIQVTGTVNPDISRTIPVISIASGRVVDIHARIGDYVKKGQLLMDVQSTDVSGAFGHLPESRQRRTSCQSSTRSR